MVQNQGIHDRGRHYSRTKSSTRLLSARLLARFGDITSRQPSLALFFPMSSFNTLHNHARINQPPIHILLELAGHIGELD